MVERCLASRPVVQLPYASFARGDEPAVMAAMDESIEWTEADGFPPVHFHDACHA